MSDATVNFEPAVMASIAFLRGADRTKEGMSKTRVAFKAMRRRFAPLQLELVVDCPPGNSRVDYDVLISTDEGETTMLGWHQDEGRPWSVDYSEHWAADYVVTVNKRHVSIRDALVFLREAHARHALLARKLVDEALIANAIEQDPPKVTEKELQRTAETFRILHGLRSEEALTRWLEETGTSRVAWQEWLAGGVRMTKFKDRICKGRIEPYFQKHRSGLAVILVHRASVKDAEVGRQLLALAPTHSLHEAICEMRWRGDDVVSGIDLMRLDEMPGGEGSDAAVGSFLGPVATDGHQVVYQLLKRRAAKLDAATRTLIRERLVSGWLAAQRATASVEWHW